METDERIRTLEKRIRQYDELIRRLVEFAQLSRAGRMIVRLLEHEGLL
jgi:hypothetical protein